MKPDSQRRLRAFIDRVEQVERYSFFNNRENIAGCTMRNVEGQWQLEFYGPSDEQMDAVLLHVRVLIQSDDISIGRLAELYDDPQLSDTWKREHERWRSALNAKLDDVHAEGAKGILRYRDVLHMFLYGHRAHLRATDPAYKLHQQWVTDETERQLLWDTFNQVVIRVLAVAHNIACASREELQRVRPSQT